MENSLWPLPAKRAWAAPWPKSWLPAVPLVLCAQWQRDELQANLLRHRRAIGVPVLGIAADVAVAADGPRWLRRPA
jgi:hypothetical protein